MSNKTVRELSVESKNHSDKSLRHFRDANEMYRQIRDMPPSSERSEALMQVLDEDGEAMREAERATDVNQEFLDRVKD